MTQFDPSFQPAPPQTAQPQQAQAVQGTLVTTQAPPVQQPAPQAPAIASHPVQRVGNNVEVTSFLDDAVKQYEFAKYEGKLGSTDRLYLLRPNQIIKVRRHFNDKTKFIICNSTYVRQGSNELLQQEAACCKVLGASSLHFGTLILKYHTDRLGQPLKPFVMPDLLIWRFAKDKYAALAAIEREHGLGNVDLIVQCTEEKFQRMTLGATAANNCIYRHPQFPPEIKQQFEAWADASLKKLPSEMGDTKSDEDILKLLGIAPGGAMPQQPAAAADQPLMDFSSLMGGVAKP